MGNVDDARARLARLKKTPTARPSTSANGAMVSLRIHGEVDEAMANAVASKLSRSGRATTLFMTVDSLGGSLNDALRIFNLIRDHPAARKIAHGTGNVMSAAALIFLAADVRRLEPQAKLLLHGAELAPENKVRWTAGKYERYAKTVAKYDARVCDIIIDRTGAPSAAIRAEMATEKLMPAPKALSLGIAHEIVGQSAPLDRRWPDQARAAMTATKRFTAGAAGYRFSPRFLAACEIAGR